MKKSKKLKKIGRKDIIDLPELELFDLEAKVDTGAFSSALHCDSVELLHDGDNSYLLVRLHPEEELDGESLEFIFDEFSETLIRNSFGQEEHRFKINTAIKIFGKIIHTDFTLSNRGALKFPLLLGRKFLKKRFIVDVSKRNLSYKKKLKKGS